MEIPDEYKNEKADCTVRALTRVSGLSYKEVHTAWKLEGRKDCKGINAKKKIQRVCKRLNIKIKEYDIGNLLCLKRGHAFPVINRRAYDLDSKNSILTGAWLII